MDADRHVVTVVIPTLGRESLAHTLEALLRAVQQGRRAKPAVEQLDAGQTAS